MDSNKDQDKEEYTPLLDANNNLAEQLAPPPEVDQLSTMQVDLNSAPQPGTMITPGGSGGNNPSSSPETSTTTPPEAPSVQPAETQVSQPQTTQPAPVVNQMSTSDVQPAVNGTIAPQIPSQPFHPTIPNSPIAPKKKGRKKLFLIIVVVIIVIIAAVGGVYAEVIIPNKPEVVLKDAFVNSIQEPYLSANDNGTVSTKDLSFKGAITAIANRNTKSAEININMSLSGITLPAQARIVGGNIYVKFGDLTNLFTGLGGLIDPNLASKAQTLNSELSNKWFVINKNTLDQAGAGCVLNTSWNFTQSDVSLLKSMYKSNSFTTINSTNSTTLNGQNVEEFHLTINNDKLNSYLRSLSNLSLVKNIEKCSGNIKKTVNSSTTSVTGSGNTSYTVWVNKSTKQIVKLYAPAEKGEGGGATVTLDYNPVTISAPSNAEPFTQVLPTIESQLQTSSASPSSSTSLF